LSRDIFVAAILLAAPVILPADEPPTLAYSLADGREADVPSWPAGTELAAAADVVLRERPSPDSRRLRSLALGERVRVLDGAAAPRVEDGFLHRWVLVEAAGDRGFVFGGFLTPLAFDADLDGDGRTEHATAAFTADARVMVRISSGARAPLSVSFRVAGEGYVSARGGSISARLVPASEAGVALLLVSTGQEACADYSRVFVSFLPTSQEPVARPRIALVTTGLTDPPSFAEPKEEFESATRSVTVRTLMRSEDGNGREVTGPDTVVRYRLRDAVYRSE
jgi:hypothetical protein